MLENTKVKCRWCQYCGKRASQRHNYGPMSYYFCDERHEQIYWWYKHNDLALFKWIRAHPKDRGPHLLNMTPDELKHNARIIKVLSRHPPLHRRKWNKILK
jgi:hypothetical protein